LFKNAQILDRIDFELLILILSADRGHCHDL